MSHAQERLDSRSKRRLPILHSGEQRPREPARSCHVVGAACVPQLSRIRRESARQFIQNGFTVRAEPKEILCLKLVSHSRLEAHGDREQKCACATLDSHVHNRLLKRHDTAYRQLLTNRLLRQHLAFPSADKGLPLRRVSTTEGTMSVCSPVSLEKRVTTNKRKNTCPTIF